MLRQISPNEAIRYAFTNDVMVLRRHDENGKLFLEVTSLKEFGTINEIMNAAEDNGYIFMVEGGTQSVGVQGY